MAKRYACIVRDPVGLCIRATMTNRIDHLAYDRTTLRSVTTVSKNSCYATHKSVQQRAVMISISLHHRVNRKPRLDTPATACPERFPICLCALREIHYPHGERTCVAGWNHEPCVSKQHRAVAYIRYDTRQPSRHCFGDRVRKSLSFGCAYEYIRDRQQVGYIITHSNQSHALSDARVTRELCIRLGLPARTFADDQEVDWRFGF